MALIIVNCQRVVIMDGTRVNLGGSRGGSGGRSRDGSRTHELIAV